MDTVPKFYIEKNDVKKTIIWTADLCEIIMIEDEDYFIITCDDKEFEIKIKKENLESVLATIVEKLNTMHEDVEYS